MSLSNKNLWPLVAALGIGVGFVGYCIYFDRQRRNAPDFVEKLKAKRRQQKTGKEAKKRDIDTSDPEEMRRYFLEKIQLGEDCLSRGDMDNGIDHLATAVVVCSQPQSLLSLFQQTLPADVFQELVIRLPRVAQSMQGSASAFAGGPTATITEPELE